MNNFSIFHKNGEGETETSAVDEWAYREWLKVNAPKELSEEKKLMWIEHQVTTAKSNMKKTQTFTL